MPSNPLLRTHQFVVLVACASSLAAQSPRFGQPGDPLPDSASTLFAAADADGDGDRDLFTGAGVLRNDGSGFFTKGPTYPDRLEVLGASGVAVADFTGDGRPDVAFCSTLIAAPHLRVWAAPAGAGTTFSVVAGAFTAVAASAPGFLCRNLAAGDADGDGDVDLLASSGSNVVRLLLNSGTGVFSEAPAGSWPPVVPAGLASWQGHLALADFDGDGLRDAFFADWSTAAAGWRKNLGGGVFGASLPLAGLNTFGGATGDFDGDGFADLARVSAVGLPPAIGNALQVHFGGPSGLGAATSHPFVATPTQGWRAADLDGDGKDELFGLLASTALASSGVRRVAFVAGAPVDLGLVATQILDGFGQTFPGAGLAIADFDGDGTPDVANGAFGGPFRLQLNAGGGALVVAPTAQPAGLRYLHCAPIDASDDGRPDLYALGQIGPPTAPFTSLHLANDGRGFGAPIPAPEPYSYVGVVSRQCEADFDGDGRVDVVQGIGPNSGAGGMILRNTGAGFASGPFIGPSFESTNALVAADVDGDGDQDVVEARGASFSGAAFARSWVPNVTIPGGPITFGATQWFGAAGNAPSVAAYDVEGDGDVDLLFGALSGPVSLYLNDGVGGFTASALLAGLSAKFVAAGDLDGDGDFDVALNGTTRLWNGAAYVAGPGFAVPTSRTALADLDRDGDLDLVEGAGRYWLNNGAAAFAAPVRFATNAGASAASGMFEVEYVRPLIADLDGDADRDVVLAGFGDPVSIFRNLTAHAAPVSVVRHGATLRIALTGPASQPWILAAATSVAGPFAIPGLGLLHLDPASLVILAAGNLPFSGSTTWTYALPPAPTFPIGLTIPWQAAVGPWLTNSFDTIMIL